MYLYFRLLHRVYMATIERKRKLIRNKTSYKDLVNVELPRGLISQALAESIICIQV